MKDLSDLVGSEVTLESSYGSTITMRVKVISVSEGESVAPAAVPPPLDAPFTPERGELYWFPHSFYVDAVCATRDSDADEHVIARYCAHPTKEAALAHMAQITLVARATSTRDRIRAQGGGVLARERYAYYPALTGSGRDRIGIYCTLAQINAFGFVAEAECELFNATLGDDAIEALLMLETTT